LILLCENEGRLNNNGGNQHKHTESGKDSVVGCKILLEEIGKELGHSVVRLSDLGEDDSMMAKGLFEHEGVAVHPGDLGMKTIADRIWHEIENLI
jgi:hypothetical protein